MKLIFTILFSILAFKAFNQTDIYLRDSSGNLVSIQRAYNITKQNEIDYLNKAKELSNFTNEDSIRKALQIFRNLNNFDSLKYSSIKIKNHLSKIKNSLHTYYKTNILGKWSLKWLGSNWGGINIEDSKKSTIIFTNDQAWFYTNDSLTRITTYSIEHIPMFRNSLIVYFQLYFYDANNSWDFGFRLKGEDYISRIKFNENNVGLEINEMPTCSCGCPEAIYIKEKTTNEMTKK